MPRSLSINRRVTRGIMPRLAASKTSKASKVVSIYPRKGGASGGGGDDDDDVAMLQDKETKTLITGLMEIK